MVLGRLVGRDRTDQSRFGIAMPLKQAGDPAIGCRGPAHARLRGTSFGQSSMIMA
jgi:hypothetical protein